MKRYRLIAPVLALVFALGFAHTALAQDGEVVPPPDARPSPLSIAQAMVGDTYVKIIYSSPRKRDRAIFGELVPFGQVWRTGANEATEITLTGHLMIGGEHVDGGTYTLFTIPGEDTWTIILNSGLGQWGAFGYNADLDVARFEVPAMTIPQTYEAFSIGIEGEDSQQIVMMWDNTKVAFSIAKM